MKGILFFVGLLIIGASADACNIGNITIAQAVMQCMVGLPMMYIGSMCGATDE